MPEPHPITKSRYAGYDHAQRLVIIEPWVDCYNRFVPRWNEVECDPAMPLDLHDSVFAGARVFCTYTGYNGAMIWHPDFIIEIRVKKRFNMWGEGLSTRRTILPIDKVLSVTRHSIAGKKFAANEWLELEQARFRDGTNSYDTVIKHKAAL